MRAAAVQLNSTEDVVANMVAADRLTRAAAADGADLVVLPEKFNLLGTHEQLRAGAETLDGPSVEWARRTAAELRIEIVAGSFAERREGHDRLANTSVHIGPDGELHGVYRKIHMFDVTVEGTEFRESESQEPGEEIVTSPAHDALLGLTVCYDLRFPELYRILAVRGARVLTVPSAFTAATGAAHWDTLLRARAIENQCFVVAADQFGPSPPGTQTYGASQIIDPWGDVLARAPDAAGAVGEPCFVAADIDLGRLEKVRAELPSLANRMPSAYRWEQEVGA